MESGSAVTTCRRLRETRNVDIEMGDEEMAVYHEIAADLEDLAKTYSWGLSSSISSALFICICECSLVFPSKKLQLKCKFYRPGRNCTSENGFSSNARHLKLIKLTYLFIKYALHSFTVECIVTKFFSLTYLILAALQFLATHFISVLLEKT